MLLIVVQVVCFEARTVLVAFGTVCGADAPAGPQLRRGLCGSRCVHLPSACTVLVHRRQNRTMKGVKKVANGLLAAVVSESSLSHADERRRRSRFRSRLAWSLHCFDVHFENSWPARPAAVGSAPVPIQLVAKFCERSVCDLVVRVVGVGCRTGSWCGADGLCDAAWRGAQGLHGGRNDGPTQ